MRIHPALPVSLHAGLQVAVNDQKNSFCIDTAHIAPIETYFSDLTNGTLPSFAFIEPDTAEMTSIQGRVSRFSLGRWKWRAS